MSLADLFPRPVPVAAGGRELMVSQLRLRDLAAIERWAVSRIVPPHEGLDEAAPTYEADLRAAYDPAREWPPEMGSAAVAGQVFGTAEGRMFVLALCLRAHGDGLGAILADLGGSITQEEWAAIEAAAWGVDDADPYMDVVARIDRLIGCPEFAPSARASGPPVPWGRAVAEACDGDPSRLEAVGDLSLSQWRAVRTGGRAERFEPFPADPGTRKVVDDLRADWWRKWRKPKAKKPNPADATG